MEVTIAQLGLIPGKSMRAKPSVDSLEFDRNGLFGDREYMWVEAEAHTNENFKPGQVAQPGQFLSQREDPVLTQIRANHLRSRVVLQLSQYLNDIELETYWHERVAEEPETITPVSVWGWDGLGVDQGDAVAEWGSEIIRRPVRLVSVSRDFPRYVEGNRALGRVGFADGFPLLVTSTASIAEVNEWLEAKDKPTIEGDRFRANILLDGVEPFEEDFIEEILVSANGLTMTLRRAKACGRCPIPDTDQVTGVRRTDVRSVLGKNGRRGAHADTAKYGTGSEIFFGQNFVTEMPDELSEAERISLTSGAKVEVVKTSHTNWISADLV